MSHVLSECNCIKVAGCHVSALAASMQCLFTPHPPLAPLPLLLCKEHNQHQPITIGSATQGSNRLTPLLVDASFMLDRHLDRQVERVLTTHLPEVSTDGNTRSSTAAPELIRATVKSEPAQLADEPESMSSKHQVTIACPHYVQFHSLLLLIVDLAAVAYSGTSQIPQFSLSACITSGVVISALPSLSVSVCLCLSPCVTFRVVS